MKNSKIKLPMPQHCTVNKNGSKTGHFQTIHYKIFIFAQIELIFAMETANVHISMVSGVGHLYRTGIIWGAHWVPTRYPLITQICNSSQFIVCQSQSPPDSTMLSTLEGPLGSYLIGKVELGRRKLVVWSQIAIINRIVLIFY